jgi:sodium pump decarboxylase gamma subunit
MLLQDGLIIMVTGMGMVYIFLTLLYLSVLAVGRFFVYMETRQLAVAHVVSGQQDGDSEVALAITIAAQEKSNQENLKN